jgi:hypothetical protein
VGLDRGVFYPQTGPGIPWNGLIAVAEEAGGELVKKFVDGQPYHVQKTNKSFAAVLQAYFCPVEFEDYDGSSGQRRRKAFGLSYRTIISDGDSADQTHLIHIVYNALASPKPVDNSSLNDGSLDAKPFSWGISTTPVKIPGAKPAAHLIIDTSTMYPGALQELEDLLYGSANQNARLPGAEELLSLIEQYATLIIIDHGDGTWTAMGPDDVVYMLDNDTFEIDWPSVNYISEDTYTVRSL